MRTKRAGTATFKKGDRVRLTKETKQRMRDSPKWPAKRRRGASGIGEVVGFNPPYVLVRFPKGPLQCHPRLLESA